MRHLVLAAGFLLSLPALCEALLHSAYRHPDESFEHARWRYQWRLREAGVDPTVNGPQTSAVTLDKLDVSAAPEFETTSDLVDAFIHIRDSRFIAGGSRPGFERRPTWLYPDDGCFARAAMAGVVAERRAFTRPGKIFAFGGLKVSTRNHPRGSVTWWYHVAPIARVGSTAYVLDPAIDPSGPIPVRDWAAHMSASPATLRLAICDTHAYTPSGPCRKAPRATEDRALVEQRNYLDREWARVMELGAAPEKWLGDSPPWRYGG